MGVDMTCSEMTTIDLDSRIKSEPLHCIAIDERFQVP